jgi:hypothetical protein
VNITVQQGFGLGEEAVLGRPRQFLTGRRRAGRTSFSSGRVVVALVDLVRIVEEQIFGDLAHLRVNEFAPALFSRAGADKNRWCGTACGRDIPQLACGLRVEVF